MLIKALVCILLFFLLFSDVSKQKTNLKSFLKGIKANLTKFK